MMGTHSLENDKVYIENDLLLFPGLSVHLCFCIHVEGLTFQIYIYVALLMLFLYFFIVKSSLL